MNVNVSHLRVEGEASGLVRITLKTTDLAGYYAEHGLTVCLSRPEALDALLCLTGAKPFSPWYDDISRMVQFTPRHIRILRPTDRPVLDCWAYFPGAELAPILTEALCWAGPGAYEYEFTPDDLKDIRTRYAPNVIWDTPDVWHNAPPMLDKLASDKADPRAPGLVRALDGLAAIAANSSDGQPVIIHLHYDERPKPGQPASYYWEIEDPSRPRPLIMNGGIIAHRSYGPVEPGQPYYANPLDKWEYSTHT